MTNMAKYGKQLLILMILSIIIVGVTAFYLGIHKAKTSTQIYTTTTTTTTTTSKTYNPYSESVKETIQNSTRIAVYHDRLVFDDLIANKYYIFTHNGVKLYTGSSFEGLLGALEYPGYYIGRIRIMDASDKVILLVNLSMKGISDYSLKIVFENEETGAKLSWPLMKTSNTTIIKMNISSIGGAGRYKLYLFGWIYTSNNEAIIDWYVDYRVPVSK